MAESPRAVIPGDARSAAENVKARPRIRAHGSRGDTSPFPNLIQLQLDSYRWFLQHGLKELFDYFSPIKDYTENLSLSFHSYYIGEPKYSTDECRERDATFEAPLKVVVRLRNESTGEDKESEVFLGELPLMTDNGTFVVNGAERAVVSQLSRSSGAYFKETMDYSGRILYSAQVIPNEGAWLELDSDANDVVWVRIGQAHKFAATTLLRALDSINLTRESAQVRCSADADLVRLFGTPEKLAEFGADDLVGRRLWEDIVDRKTGEVVAQAGAKIDRETAKTLGALNLRKVEVAALNPLIDATMDRDPATDEDSALLDIYRRERPGDPATPEIARARLRMLFADVRRYDLGKVGRYKMNKKLGTNLPESVRTLAKEDIVAILRYMIRLSEGDETAGTDEIDHLMNKRVRCVGELLEAQFRIGFLRMERIARERMTSLDPEQVTPQAVISTKPISAAIKSFFGSSQLSQFMDQTNPLAELTHKRRLSALGPGGLSRQSAKLEVRDVHYSHYGRICPIETPEGPNIGLIGALAVYARLNEYGFIQTPYRQVKRGVVTDDIDFLSADEEDQYHIAPADTPRDERGRILPDMVTVRYRSKFPQVRREEVDYCDLSPRQIVSVATCLIPFLENDDANRALMGSNMQRQAVPLVRSELPYVSTGLEGAAARDSGAVVLAKSSGRVEAAEATEITVRLPDGQLDRYPLLTFRRSNAGTCIHQKPLVRPGDFVKEGDILADGPSTQAGELALGRNILCAFMPWEGLNYEDAILVSDRLVKEDIFTSVHIERYETDCRETKMGPEEITRDIPNVGDEALKDLDEDGIVRIGAEVRSEDILVGKVAPKIQEELTSEEKLVRAIFGEKAAEMRDTSLRVPHGEKGKVVGVVRFSRFKARCSKCEREYMFSKDQHRQYCDRCGGELQQIAGDELPPGVNQMVRVYVAQSRKLTDGDKMAGRHGNKGVIAKILPECEMPFLPDGTPVDVVLNPLGVPSRMNIGQVLETHLGLVAHHDGVLFQMPIFEGAGESEILELLAGTVDRLRREKLDQYVREWMRIDVPGLKGAPDSTAAVELLRQRLAEMPEELDRLAERVGVRVRDWDSLEGGRQKADFLAEAILARANDRVGFDETTGKCKLLDGRTGEPFAKPVTVGYTYVMKLAHLADDKIHARSTGPYSLVTQQPLGGKAQFGGQRFGEMEVWALEAYGAAHTLQEILTIKSDDVLGRVRTYESIVKGENIMEPGIPESFKILLKELQSLGLSVSVESKEEGAEEKSE
jgi:DNA-directed RNA polymerase subunit beta